MSEQKRPRLVRWTVDSVWSSGDEPVGECSRESAKNKRPTHCCRVCEEFESKKSQREVSQLKPKKASSSFISF